MYNLTKNDWAVFEALHLTGGATRDEIAMRCDLPRGMVYHALTRLERLGLVVRDCAVFLLTATALHFFVSLDSS